MPRRLVKLRPILWKAHRWIGLFCLLPMTLVVLSGIALLILPSLDAAYTSPTAPAGIDRALADPGAVPGARVQLVLPPASTAAGWTIMLNGADHKPRIVHFDGNSGVLGIPFSSDSSPRTVLLDLHNALLLGAGGKILVLLTAFGVIVLAVSGFAIMRARLRVLRRVHWHGASPSVSLHKWAGLVGMAMLLLWATSGAFLLGFKMLGGRRPASSTVAAHASPPRIALAARTALAVKPGSEIMGIMPGDGSGPVTVMLLDRSALPWPSPARSLLTRTAVRSRPIARSRAS
ncbi:PepSY-associated transmembrane protein [Novosphingobium sp. PhB55]|uniref:PepSY-associated TM helix domain-containing protein n=1 Tax=Novosphingobium sp. PhB55 TaxID=2485106 RepID=UPI001066FAB7|nr:PepSY-associated TM helix domain-containing protein [Novosphingobium sp. PhB55]TDW59969.1 PepSY-associated transmembrane protein [Novosphingobium sp. PhB55]